MKIHQDAGDDRIRSANSFSPLGTLRLAWVSTQYDCWRTHQMESKKAESSAAAVTAPEEECKEVKMTKEDCSGVYTPQQCLEWVRKANQELAAQRKACLQQNAARFASALPQPHSVCKEWNEKDCLKDRMCEYKVCIQDVREHNAACRKEKAAVACEAAKKEEQTACKGLPHVHGGGPDGIELRREDQKECEAAQKNRQVVCEKK